MHIKEIVSQHRRDFTAIYACANCGHEQNGRGYDDDNFHDNVIPNMECRECGQSGGGQRRATKYPAHVTI